MSEERTYSWVQIGALTFLRCNDCGQTFKPRPMMLQDLPGVRVPDYGAYSSGTGMDHF